MSTKCIGIDLGTGNSCVAVMEGGKATVIANAEGQRTTPSVIFIKGDERIVGGAAKRKMVTAPQNTVSFIKRFMGSQYNDSDVQKMLKQITYKVENKDGKPAIMIEGSNYTPEQISSFILEKLKDVASDYYGEKVTNAVITVPAWFNDIQRQATKTAGELAGLNVLRIINEPTAAILASDFQLKDGEEKLVAVFDYGCGTLDISVCELSMNDGQLMVEVLSSHGDVFLGGQNYDNAIVQWLIDEFKKEHDGIDLSKDPMAYSRLVEAAEKAKIELSTAVSTEINLPYIIPVDGIPQHLVVTLSRAKFEQLTADITKKAIDCTRTAFEKAKKEPNEIDSILLVGGSTRMLAVKDALTNAFGIKLESGLNPDESVALGAVTQANVLVGGKASTDILLLDVTPLTVGIETVGGIMTPMITANTTIPTSKTEIFSTSESGQSCVSIRAFQGERTRTADCKLLGQFDLGGIMPAPRGVPKIAVTFDIDANGILKVSAKDEVTGKANNITITGSGSLSKEEIEKIKADAERFKAEDDRIREEVAELNGAESYAYQIKTAVNDEDLKDKISAEDRQAATEKAEAVIEAVKSKDLGKVKSLKEDLESCYNAISAKLYEHYNQTAAEQPHDEQQQATADNGGNAQQEAQDVEFEEVK